MKLLVPTDFSQLSKIAVQYATGLNKDCNLELVLLHVINTSTPPMARSSSNKLKETIKLSSVREMNELIQSIKKNSNHDLKIDSKIVYDSSIAKGVEAFALKNNIDIICIGTKGATGLKKIIFGSNAADIISNSSIPVLTIPEYAEYKGIRNIVYSCDLENLEEELQRLIPYAKQFNAEVHILHINMDQEDFNNYLKDRENDLRTYVSYDRIQTKILKNDSVIEGINQYVTFVQADMVAMFTRHTSLVEKLFHKSITKMAAFQAMVPLLTFQKQ